MQKTAFLVLAHHQPQMVRRLTDRLQHPAAHVFVHVDGKADSAPFRAAIAGRAQLVPDAQRLVVHWCGFSTLAAMLLLLKTALAAEPDLQRFVMLSGVDYPVRSIEDILAGVAVDREFLSVEHALDWTEEYYVNRHAYRYYLGDSELFNDRSGPPLAVKLARAAERRLRRPQSYGADIFHGSGWWALTREAVDYLMAAEREDPRRLSWFKWATSPDEMYFQTLLKQSPRADRIVHDLTRGPRSWSINLRGVHYVDWLLPNPHLPRTLEMGDLPAILESGALFARKMDPIRSAGLMDALDDVVRPSEPVLA